MKTYTLYASGRGFCFEDERKASDAIFYSKQRGIDILLSMIRKRKISAMNALSLLREVVALPYLPIVERKKGDTDWLRQDLDALVRIKSIEHLFILLEKLKMEKYSKPTVVLCPNCRKHANILSSKLFSQSFFSKEVGRQLIEEMHDDNLITLADKLKLEKELKEIDLPEESPPKANPREN